MRTILTTLIFVIICTNHCSAQDEEGIKIVNGRRFSIFPYERVDTITVVDPVSGDEVQQTRTLHKSPYLVNGRKIFNNGEVTTPVWSKPSAAATFEEDIIQKLNDELTRLPDGSYNIPIRHIVVNKKGRIIYYSIDSNFKCNPASIASGPYVNNKLDADAKLLISAKLDQLFYDKKMRLIPARIKHKKVTAFYNTYFTDIMLKISDHKVSIDTAKSILPRERRY